MREGFRRFVATIVVCALLVAVPAAGAHAQPPVSGAAPPGGGSAAPDGEGGSAAGDVRLRRALIRAFAVAPRSLTQGQAARFSLRVSGLRPGLRARVELRQGRTGRVIRVSLGAIQAGHAVHVRWTGTNRLAPGAYVAHLVVVDRYGDAALSARTARRARLRVIAPAAPPSPAPPAPSPAPAPAPAPAPPSGDTAFPIAGPHDYGGPDSRFGAGRAGHTHQGQDVAAAEGTPLVAPRPGTITTVDYQAGGAGYYVVIRGDDGRDYAFMHFQAGTVVVAKGQRVAAGQRLASVGHTGDAQGDHLHFEIWPDGWYSTKGSKPIDPLPDLQAWAAAG